MYNVRFALNRFIRDCSLSRYCRKGLIEAVISIKILCQQNSLFGVGEMHELGYENKIVHRCHF